MIDKKTITITLKGGNNYVLSGTGKVKKIVIKGDGYFKVYDAKKSHIGKELGKAVTQQGIGTKFLDWSYGGLDFKNGLAIRGTKGLELCIDVEIDYTDIFTRIFSIMNDRFVRYSFPSLGIA